MVQSHKTIEIIVGNIGCVYRGGNPAEANAVWGDYVNQSRRGVGRAAGESVTYLIDGEPEREHEGSVG